MTALVAPLAGPAPLPLLAGLAMGGAVLLLLPRRGWSSGTARPGPAPRHGGAKRRSGVLLVGAVLVAGLVAVLASVGAVPGASMAAALVLTAAALGGALVGRAGRRRGRAVATSAHVLVACELLAAELVAGVPPSRALERAAADWAVLAPVARAETLGADVPAALRAAATVPGADDLRRVAAAWEVSLRTGQGLATALARTASGLRTTAATRRTVAAELASARATARLLAVLPVGVLLLGSGSGGGAAWRFLLATPAGVACLAGGTTLGLLGLAWIERLASTVEAGSA